MPPKNDDTPPAWHRRLQRHLGDRLVNLVHAREAYLGGRLSVNMALALTLAALTLILGLATIFLLRR
jgi:hypothetical protein